MEKMGLEKMLKLFSLHLETQAETVFQVYECWSGHGRRDCSSYRNGADWASRHQVSIENYTVLSTLIFIGKLLLNL
jgi:hypothetical protein